MFRMDPLSFIFYSRHTKRSKRFYSAEVDTPDVPPILNEAGTPLELFLGHDFTRRKDTKSSVPDYQLVVNQVSLA